MEPTSTSASAAGIAAWKAIGGLAGFGACGAGLATVVVMCVLRPRTQSEWVVGIISTVVASISGGAAVIQHYELHHWAQNPMGLVAMLGLTFACGLPGWAIVRWGFNFFDKRRKADILDIVDEVRGLARGERK
ncbi:hypothetical protein L1889_18425 [Paenalcaligenes niemegkensis]|uniref:hypothetical protein n=1 Tax=Paenalcaligenes niemegkensis TaxID=2895469 RepID=UPI001EE90F01|nr:hypothetical protein [Paenalcaligenes niemegkensis]MCQ9618417.1 hypothetical protein [Paenalcaligenes niemegkensis]